MTSYAVNGGNYPAYHYGGHVKGNEYACFCERSDLIVPDARVLAIPSAPVSVLSATPISVDESFFGISVKRRSNDRFGVLTAKTVRTHDMELGKSRWQYVQPTRTTWDFFDLDLWVLAHELAGRDMIFTFFGTPQWASARQNELNAYSDPDDGGPIYSRGIAAEPGDMADWDAYVTKIVTRYRGRIQFYEIWNEPNIGNNGTTLPNPTKPCFFTGTWATLAEMTRRASQIIRAIDPAARIISPAVQGWAATGTDTSGAYLAGMFAASDGAGGTMEDSIDIVGVHLYCDTATTTLAGLIDRALAARAAAGLTGKEIWDTESGLIGGATSMSDAQIATYLTRSMLTMAAKGINRTVYYELDHGTMGFEGRMDVYYFWNSLRETLMSGRIQYVNRLSDGRLVYDSGAGMTII